MVDSPMSDPAPTQFHVGAARVDLGTPQHDIGMMGWGMLHNVVRGVATPLHARAFVVRDGTDTLALVCVELAFISTAVKQAVCRRLVDAHPQLGLTEDNLLLMATHTHSGPGGFTHYPFYNVTIPGFVPEVCAWIADGIVAALLAATQRLQPGWVRYVEGPLDPEAPVAFNRTVASYNLNPEVTPRRHDERHLALDRTMRLLRFDDATGRPIAALNWFAVHCTSVHSDNTAVHFDNKGYAAQMLEDSMRAEGNGEFVGAFAQGAAGDVTPNFRRHRGKPWTRGAFADDDESARDNGRHQMHCAAALIAAADDAPPLAGPLRCAHTYVDFSDVEVAPRYADGQSGRHTGPGELGMAMFFGTEEGPGLPREFLFAQRLATWARPFLRRLRSPAARRRLARHDEVQGEKVTLMEGGQRRFLGISRLRRVPLPWSLHPALRQVRELDHNDHDDPKPWTPQILPLQVMQLGPVAIAAVPAEFTTVAGMRLRSSVLDALAVVGVRQAVLSGYSNAYCGYVTTAQEYTRQAYEGASTHFGKWTLAAYQTEFDRLCAALRSDRSDRTNRSGDRGPRPPRFDGDDLAGRLYVAPR
jgi:neutral ceramidase